MTASAYARDTCTKTNRITIGSICKVPAVPANFTVVCLWALIGLAVTALVVVWVGSVDFAGFLAAAG
jgi:hypothetical protein